MYFVISDSLAHLQASFDMGEHGLFILCVSLVGTQLKRFVLVTSELMATRLSK